MCMFKWFQRAFFLYAIACASGCATSPYRYGTVYRSEREYVLPPGEPQFERGRPNTVLDASDWYTPFSLLGKLLIWNWKIDRHYISPDTEVALTEYLHANALTNVKVRLNQYNPGDEWRRLVRNRAVGAGWRYTLGVFSIAFYTILPG